MGIDEYAGALVRAGWVLGRLGQRRKKRVLRDQVDGRHAELRCQPATPEVRQTLICCILMIMISDC